MSTRNRILCIANQKGGVGKTTTAVNPSSALSPHGMTVLLIDLDPHCATTHHLMENTPKQDIIEAMRDPRNYSKYSIRVDDNRFDLIPSSRGLTAHATDSKKVISSLVTLTLSATKAYNYVIIDTPPDLNTLQMAGIYASTDVIVPIYEFMSMKGVVQLQELVDECNRTDSSTIRTMRLVATKVDMRTNLAKTLVETVKSTPHSFKTVIPYNIKLAEAPAVAKTIFQFAPESTGATAYLEMADEIILRGD